jgi:hypothetical protein
MHLGATRILAVSTRHHRSFDQADRPAVRSYPPPLQIASQLLNAIFLDVLDQDALRVERTNALLRRLQMLRPYLLHHRELLGGLCRAGWEVVRELMASAVGDPAFRPGMVAVVQTHGDMLGWPPHVHAIATRGGWDAEGQFVPMSFVSTAAAEQLFRHEVITLLRDEGLLTEERIELLMSWHHSGVSAHNAVTVPPRDSGGIERLARYWLRALAALERLELDLEGRSVRYRVKSSSGRARRQTFEITEFLARLLQRLLQHVPEPRLHQVRYYGHYSNVARSRRAPCGESAEVSAAPEAPEPGAGERRRLRRSWAQLIHRIYEVDPLTCTE